MILSFTKKYPYISGLMIVVLTMVLPWGLMYPLSKYLDNYLYQAIKYAVSLLISLGLIFLIYKSFSFKLKSKSLFKNLFTFGLLGMIGAIMAFLFSIDKIDSNVDGWKICYFALYVLFVALSEELIFRILILNIFLEAWENKQNFVLKAVIFASIIFGLRHLLNLITMPNTLYSTLAQVLFTFMAGVYLSALYLRTSSIIPCLIIHYLEDFGQGIWMVISTNTLNNQITDANPLMMLLLVGLQSIYLVFGILMLKDKNYQYETLRRKENV